MLELLWGWLSWPFTTAPALSIIGLAFFTLCVPFGIVSWLRTRKETNRLRAERDEYWRQRGM